jgi:hypothetical protein
VGSRGRRALSQSSSGGFGKFSTRVCGADPHDLLITYPSEPMTMWPISTRVNKPENDDPSILDRMAEPLDWQAPLLVTPEG